MKSTTQKKGPKTKAEKTNIRPWSDLPEDILIAITRHLSTPSPADFIRFGAVCKSWQQITSITNHPSARNMPLLMLAEDNPKCSFRRFFSPSEDKIYKLLLPESRATMICTSAGGYVLTIGTNLEMHLLNPFTRHRVQLPSVERFNASFYQGRNYTPRYKQTLFVRKVCLSSSPLRGKKWTALALYGSGNKLAFAKPGDLRWTSIECRNWWPFKDAVFYKGRFYATNHRGDVVSVDLRRHKLEMVACTPCNAYISATYLVESSGDLLQVMRYRWFEEREGGGLNYGTEGFRAYKLMPEGPKKWEEVKSLGSRSIFIGLNNSFSMEAPCVKGCRQDCIYFTDDYLEGFSFDEPGGGHDMGVYSMKDRSVEPHFKGSSLSLYSPPLWIAPFECWK